MPKILQHVFFTQNSILILPSSMPLFNPRPIEIHQVQLTIGPIIFFPSIKSFDLTFNWPSFIFFSSVVSGSIVFISGARYYIKHYIKKYL